MTKTVLLVCDHAGVRTSVRALLEALPDLQVVAITVSTPDCLRQVAIRPDAAVIDGALPEHGAERLVSALHASFPEAAIIVLSLDPAPSYVAAMLRAGARGLLMKETAARELEPALRAVVAGETYLGAHLRR